jgi:hypothetical protein
MLLEKETKEDTAIAKEMLSVPARNLIRFSVETLAHTSSFRKQLMMIIIIIIIITWWRWLAAYFFCTISQKQQNSQIPKLHLP